MARKRSTDTVTPTPADTPAPEVTDTPADDTATDTPTPAPEPVPDSTDSTDSTPEPDSTDTPAPEVTDTPEPDPADTFGDTFRAALEGADPVTGTVSVEVLAGVVAAYRAVPARKRDTALLEAQTAATATAVSDPAAVRVGMLTGSAALVEACRASGSAPAAPAVTDTDRRHALAVALFTLTDDTDTGLRAALSGVLGVSADDTAALGAWVTSDSTDTDPAGIVRARRALSAVSGRGKRSGGTGSRSNAAGGKRGTGIADHVRAALEAHGEPMKVSAIVAAHTDTYPADGPRPSSGAVSGALKKGTVPGVVATTVEGVLGGALEA